MDVEGEPPDYLSVRETARRLGVHENTVRNWAGRGTLPTARIPGSRFHRFDARDVERLRRQRGAVVSSVEGERRTIGPELVDGSQLSQWAATRDSHDRFPELMRRLLAATPGITGLSVRSGDGVSAGGWDGRAESSGSAYLPAGTLRFEFGVGGSPKTKADEDYRKRRDAGGDPEPAQVIFVFVTPRRWAGAGEWASERRAEGTFSDIRVLDADDLEGWLQATPAVHYWVSERLGRRPRKAQSLEQWWSQFRNRTEPPLPAALFLAGRDDEQKRLREFFGSPPAVTALQAGWRDEAIAFLCAVVEAMDREDIPVQPPLVVSSTEVWDRVVAQPGGMTLIPLFDDADIATAQERGHHVVLPIGGGQVVRGTKIELPRPHRREASEALEAAGIESDRSYELAALARRSMPSLVRKLARDPRLALPLWSQPPAAEIIAPLALVGAWTASEQDTDTVSRLVDQPWSAIERTLLHWRATDDPPFVRSGTQWQVASPEEAFLVLRQALTADDLERWHRIAVDVLLETDPALDLLPEDRPMAGVKGIVRAHSAVLRRGLAEGAALVGSVGDERLSDGTTGADHARRVVRELLEGAGVSQSGQVWRSLSDVLPLLAEGAPETFLDAVHDDLDRDEPLLKTMFQDTHRGSGLYASSPHTGLLWALETLCWSPDFLLDASRALARLAAIDPGGRLSNRPLASLEHILVGWIRHTAAPVELKSQAVGQICRREPEVGWHLLLALWPTHHGTSMPPSAPRLHDWKPETRGVSIAEWIDYIGSLVRLAIELAGANVQRWSDLSERLGALPPAERESLLSALEGVADPNSLEPSECLVLWERLRGEIAKHERFSTAEWSMKEEPLSRLRAIADRLEPKQDAQRFGYLFDWRPDISEADPTDHEAYETALREMRRTAVSDALERASIDGLIELAEKSPVPMHLGWTVGELAKDAVAPRLFTWLDSDNPKLRDVARSWAERKLLDEGVSWLRDALARPEMTVPARRTTLVLSAPPRAEVWDALDVLDSDLSDSYWEGMGAWRVSPEDAARATRELLARDRPWTAVDLLAAETHLGAEGPSSVTPPLVGEVLDAAITSDPREARAHQTLGYELGLLLDYLEAEGSDSASLARYEFVFFHLLEDHRQPRALFATLSSDPSLFVDLVSRVYRGKNEPHRQLDEQEEALAHHAWWVLDHWHGLPGRRDDGAVDGEHLTRWVRDARLAFADSERADIGDEQIGQVLSAGSAGADGIWPTEAVREIVETIGSPSLETGIHVGVINSRGVTSRDVYAGGKQERELATRYREWARQTSGTWPRTSRVLRGLAESFERDAQREDARAEVTADTE